MIHHLRVIPLLIIIFLLSTPNSYAQKTKKVNYKGQILDIRTKEALPGAVVSLPQYSIFATTDLDGFFLLRDVPVGKTTINIRYVGMLPITEELVVEDQHDKVKKYEMYEENFSLKEVTVVATNNKTGASTSSSISRSAIDHLQATSLGDILELLPGHLSSNPTLNSPSRATLRQIQSDALNSMGTSIVFNGAPISNNANLQIGNTAKEGSLNTGFASSAGSGLDLREISVDNIESVDVIRGIPSVEYGDMTSGVIIINPKAGVYPFQVKMKINPTLTQASIGKGFQLGKKGGNLSVDFDYAKSLSDERRPYQGFQRFTSNILYSKTIGENLFTTTGFGFYSDLDATKLDPSDAQYQRERRAENLGFKFNTNIVWNQTSDFFKFIKLNVSANYARQKGYNQEIKGNFGYMVTSAMQDGTITSNRKEDIFDSTGQQITNASKLDPTALTNILPYEFLTKMSTYGNPLNIFTKLSANFFKEIGSVKNRIVAGVDWKTDVNFGKGKVFDPLMPPSSGLRMRPYSDIPALNQLSAYVEDNITTEIANREFMLQLGVRADAIQPGRKENRTVISPRFNVSYEVIPKIMTLKGGWGITAKAPPLMFLYPDKAYFDYVNYDNLGATGVTDDQKLSIITTKVYDTVSQKLKIAKNTKSEIGADFRFGQTTLSVTGYNEILRNGYTFGRNSDTFHQFELVKYKTLNNRPGTYPELAVDKTSNVILSYNTPMNDKVNKNQGIEFDFSSGQIAAIRTQFVFNGAWMRSRSYSTAYSFYQKNPDSDGNYKDIGIYEAGDGTEYKRFSTNLRIIHNIPKISFLISLSIQTIWHDSQSYLGIENKTPIGYISAKDLSMHMLQPGDAINPDWQKQILENREIVDRYSPLWLFNLRLTKELKRFGGFAFFVNNLFMYTPLEESKRSPGTYKTRNPEQFFGAEVWLKF